MSRAFGGALKGAKRFDGGDWTIARRLPYLIDAQANLFCTTESVTHFGTHGIFIGRVEDVRVSEDASPLVYQDGHYMRTAQLVEPRWRRGRVRVPSSLVHAEAEQAPICGTLALGGNRKMHLTKLSSIGD
jgi:hypothetical protein